MRTNNGTVITTEGDSAVHNHLNLTVMLHCCTKCGIGEEWDNLVWVENVGLVCLDCYNELTHGEKDESDDK